MHSCDRITDEGVNHLKEGLKKSAAGLESLSLNFKKSEKAPLIYVFIG